MKKFSHYFFHYRLLIVFFLALAADGENLAHGYTTAQKLLDAWIASTSHHANMLGRHTRMGFGIFGTYTTTLFR